MNAGRANEPIGDVLAGQHTVSTFRGARFHREELAVPVRLCGSLKSRRNEG
jgi:hypothetical protein